MELLPIMNLPQLSIRLIRYLIWSDTSHTTALLFLCSTVPSFHHLVSLSALSAAMPLAFGPASLMPRSGSATPLLCWFYVARSVRGLRLQSPPAELHQTSPPPFTSCRAPSTLPELSAVCSFVQPPGNIFRCDLTFCPVSRQPHQPTLSTWPELLGIFPESFGFFTILEPKESENGFRLLMQTFWEISSFCSTQ